MQISMSKRVAMMKIYTEYA